MAADPSSDLRVVIPASNYESGRLELQINDDDKIFIVGPNGSGKSALIQHFVVALNDRPIRRISAHRQTWFGSSLVELTPKSRRSLEADISARERVQDSRWKDDYASHRLMTVLFDLVDAENRRSRQIAELVTEGQNQKARETAQTLQPVFKRLNELLRIGNLTVQIETATGEEILAHHVGGSQFSIAKLSDGERNAIILGATILTVEPGTVLLIDEPERHLHRSIIEPLLTALFESRTDCPFVISTHELSLPTAAIGGRVLLPRSCQWENETPISWDIDVLETGSDLPLDLKKSVLGSRKKILFVEGTPESLDAPIYGLLFPNTTVTPKGPCYDVIRAVNGLRAVEDIHWLKAYGLIDRDDRTDDEIIELQDHGIFALTVHSAEAIYFSNYAMKRLAERQAETLGCDGDKLLNAAATAALAILGQEDNILRLCARRCERLIRSQILSTIPNWEEIQSGDDLDIEVSVKDPYEQEIKNYREFLDNADLDGLISRYPVRDTSALDEIAKKLEFKGRAKYEKAVLAMIDNDTAFREELWTLVSPLPDAING